MTTKRHGGLGERFAAAVGLYALAGGLARAAAGAFEGERPTSAARRDGDDDRAVVEQDAGGHRPEIGGFLGRFAGVPVLGTAIRVQKRYGELKGNALAGALAFQVFTSLFPLLLVIVAVAGYASRSGVDVAGGIVRQLGLTGDAAASIGDAMTTAQNSRQVASVLGLAGLLWSGLGLVAAFQFVFNQAWQVEERGMKDKAVGAAWLVGAALLFVAAAAATTLLRWLPGPTAALAVVVAFAVNLALWTWSFRILPNTRLPIRTVLPGAIAGAVGLEILKVVGAVYVPRAVANSSQLYGTIGVVVAVLAWLYLFGRLVVYATTLNVVLHERRAGTVTATIEVPRQPGADPSDEASRAGRLDKGDLAA